MSEWVLASGNPGKLAEFRHLLSGLGITIRPQSEFRVAPVEETGLTFIENALLKARHAADICAMPAMADDSGLEVDALEGAPGVFSSRYAGVGAGDEANREKLLAALGGVPPERRTARFYCVIVAMRHALDPTPRVAVGEWRGRILESPAGTGGFGYDPVFFVPEAGCAAAELPPSHKNRLSHRARAMHALLRELHVGGG